jgi:hypothetical protein
LTQPSAEQPTLSERSAAAVDLGVALAVFLMCSLVEPRLDPLLRRGHGLTGVFEMAGYQFACEGLALFAILAVRHERPSTYGFTRSNLARSLGLGLLFAVILDLALSYEVGALLWIPLRRHSATRMALALGFPMSVVGLALTVTVWGLIEAFFGVFFARKLNVALRHDGHGWRSPGALGFALFNGAIHFLIGQGLEGFVTSFASGYAIAVIPALTGNAWGSALVQTLTNAVGKV